MKLNPDLAYGTLAAIAVGGCISPLLFPLAGALKTVNLVSSIAAAGILAAGHQTGGWQRAKRQHEIIRVSEHELFMQRRASHEALELKRIEQRELIETLALLDELTLPEQKYFLDQLGMPELLPIYLPAAQPEPEAIEVAASPVKDEPSPFTGTLRWAVDSVTQQASQPTQPQAGQVVDTTFEEVDLGRAIAEMMAFGEDSGMVPLSVLLACPARTGKTTLLTLTIAWLHKLTEGNARVKIWNGKEHVDSATGKLKDTFLGLAYNPAVYQRVETSEEGSHFADYYHKEAESLLEPRQHPTVDFLDEFNNCRQRIADGDKKSSRQKAQWKILQTDIDTGRYITSGSSRNRFLFITSHSSYVSHLGVDRSYQDSLHTIVLGRGGKLDALYKALSTDKDAPVRNKVQAKELLTKLQDWEYSEERDQSKVVCLTNLISGKFDLYFAKYVDLSKIEFASAAEADTDAESEGEDPYEFWDEDYQDGPGKGKQPEDEPDWEDIKPSSAKPKQPSQKELLDALAAWIKQLGRLPSDEELRAKAAELAYVEPVTLSDESLKGMKWMLSQRYGIEGFQFD